MTITLSDIEQFLVSGWTNTQQLDLSRLVDSGTTITVILSDGEFVVPDTMASGAVVIDSRQYTFTAAALMKIRAITRLE